MTEEQLKKSEEEFNHLRRQRDRDHREDLLWDLAEALWNLGCITLCLSVVYAAFWIMLGR